MKKTLAITFAVASTIAAANAQVAPLPTPEHALVAGWSFSGIVAASSFDAVAADKSDFLPDAVVGSNIGYITFNTTIGDPFAFGGAGVVYNTVPGGLPSSTDILTRALPSEDFVNNDDRLIISQDFVGPVNTSFDIIINTTDLGSSFQDWEVRFAADGANIGIDWSYDIGNGFQPISNSATNTVDKALSFGIAGALSDTITLRGTFDGFESGVLTLDNLAVYGLVPEPSTYAAIAGALALGFVAYRRRK